MFQRLHFRIFFRMIEPSRTNRNIHFRRIPEKFRSLRQHRTASQIFRFAEYAQTFVILLRTGVNARSKHRRTPFSFTSQTFFITNPTHIIAHYCHHSLRLQTLNRFIESFPVIYLLPSVRSLPIRSVKPNFVYLPIIGKQLCQLTDKEVVISGRISITFRVTIPRRKINAKLHIIFIASLTQFPYYIALSFFPRRRSYGMFGGSRRPKTKSIMMFCRQQHHLETSFFKSTNPLFRIQFGWIKQRRIFFSISPFTSGKGIDTKMEKSSQLHLLPRQLLGSRD